MMAIFRNFRRYFAEAVKVAVVSLSNSSTMKTLKNLSSDVVTAVNKLDFRFTASRKASALKTIAALQAAIEALDAAPPKAVNAPTPPKAAKAAPKAPKAKPTARKTRTAKPRTSSAGKLENKSAAQSIAKQALPVNSSPIGAITKADKVSKPKAVNAPAPSKTAKPRTKAEAVALGLKIVEVKPSQPKAANTKPRTASPQGLDQITEAMSAIANAVGANASRIESLEQRVARIEAEQIALQSFSAPF